MIKYTSSCSVYFWLHYVCYIWQSMNSVFAHTVQHQYFAIVHLCAYICKHGKPLSHIKMSLNTRVCCVMKGMLSKLSADVRTWKD